MSDLQEFENESLPVRYILKEAMTCPEYRDAMPLERLLSRYYYTHGNLRLGSLVSDVIRRHFTPTERFQRSQLDDTEAKEILTDLIKKGVIDGQYHFVAVYRVLTDFCHFPPEITSFCNRIIKYQLTLHGKQLDYKSLYQSVQKGINSHSALSSKYKYWCEYQPKDDERFSTFKRQKVVADRLVSVLRERKILLTE